MNHQGRIVKKRDSHLNIPFMENLLRLPHHEFVQRLQEMDCDLNHKHKCKATPLHDLIKQGININARNEDGSSRLENAVEKDDIEEACMLLYYGADVNTPNEFNQKVLNIALSNCNLDIALILINYCDDISATNVYTSCIALLSKDSRLASQVVANSKSEEILVNYFKQISHKIYQELISNSRVRFLADYLQDCDYSGSNFLECLNMILDLPNSGLLIKNFKRKYNSENFWNLLNAFLEKNINRRDRTATIWTWVRLGGQVSITNINLAVYLFGFNEEVEALIYTTFERTVCGFRILSFSILPLTIFILALEEDLSTVSILECYLSNWYHQGMPQYISFSRRELDFSAKQVVLNSLRYFTIPDRIKWLILKRFKNTALHCLEMVHVLRKLPRVPKLVELSRDESRRYIKKVYEIRKPYQFHEAVNNLNLPLTIKDIIRFKRPIYNGCECK